MTVTQNIKFALPDKIELEFNYVLEPERKYVVESSEDKKT